MEEESSAARGPSSKGSDLDFSVGAVVGTGAGFEAGAVTGAGAGARDEGLDAIEGSVKEALF